MAKARAKGTRRGRTTRTAKRVEAWKRRFLRELAETGVVGHACRRAKVGRSTAYEQREKDKEFAEAWVEAEEAAMDDLEVSALRRAKRSNALTMFLLSTKRRSIYGKTITVQGSMVVMDNVPENPPE